ncbi:hypothetical protein [Thermogutta sp.]|uniref:hypothetical protein n=1 Tax=Thermogutta sp. TaxID=1962930 RepID=UPI00321FE232
MNSTHRQRVRSLGLMALAILDWLVVWLAFFQKSVFSDWLPLFRDSANLYYPLWLFVREQFHAGVWPWWNPYLVLGAPLMAEGIAGVFYPGIIVFLLPLPFRWCYLLFLLTHMALAGWGAFRLARRMGASPPAAFWAAFAYPFSGYLLFQIYNPIYLISGAWLPFALAGLLELMFVTQPDIRAPSGTPSPPHGWTWFITTTVRELRHSGRPLMKSSVSLAMMCLGGDPQTAYHCGLVALVTWLVRSAIEFRRMRTQGGQVNTWKRAIFFIGGKLMLVFGLAFLLAAVQLIPTAVYASRCDRALLAGWPNQEMEASTSAPGNANFETTSQALSWWQRVAEQERQDYYRAIYDFSTPAYRWIEYFWPNFGGRPFPYHTRWITAAVEEGRWWVPTLYQGFITALLAILGGRLFVTSKAARTFRSNSTRCHQRLPGNFCSVAPGEIPFVEDSLTRIARVWLSWMGVLSAVAALGWYGPAGVLTEIVRMLTGYDLGHAGILPPMGGLYWLFVLCLPRYGLFRYPSKWLVFSALAVAVLASVGLDEIQKDRGLAKTLFRRVVVTGGLVCFGGVVLMVALHQSQWWSATADDMLFGPFQRDRAAAETLVTIVSLLGVMTAVGVAIRWFRPAFWPIALSVVLAVDLLFHNGWLVVAVRPPEVSRVAASSEVPRRFWQPWCWYPSEWSAQASPNRIQEICDWEFATGAFRWGTLRGEAPLENYGTILPADQAVLLSLLRAWRLQTGEVTPPRSWLAQLGVTSYPQSVHHRDAPFTYLEDPVAIANETPWVEITHDWRVLFEHRGSLGETWERIASIQFPGGQPRGPNEVHVVELPEAGFKTGPVEGAAVGELSHAVSKECAEILQYRPGKVEIRARLFRPGLVILREGADPGWRVSVKFSEGVYESLCEPVRVDGIFMGVFLSSGIWHLTWTYYPPGLAIGALLSICGWILVLGVALSGMIARP